jgi:hypothetical protein
MEINAKLNLKRPVRCPQGPGDQSWINGDKASSSFWYYRRTAKRRISLAKEAVLNNLNELDPALGMIYDNRNTVVENLDELHQSTVGGHYLPPARTSQPGTVLNEEGAIHQVHPTGKILMAPGFDVTAAEQPTHNQEVAVCKELVLDLQQYAMFKTRTVDLLQSIKNKASQLVKRYNNSAEWKTHQIAMASALAFEPSEAEMLALTHIKSPAVASKWTWVNDVLRGGNKDLVECLQTKPKLITRVLNYIYASPDPLTAVPVNKQALGPR